MNSAELQQGILNRLKGVGGLNEKAKDAVAEKDKAVRAQKIDEFIKMSLKTLLLGVEPGPFIAALNQTEYGFAIRRITDFLIKSDSVQRDDWENDPEYVAITQDLAQNIASFEQQMDELAPKLAEAKKKYELLRMSGVKIDEKNEDTPEKLELKMKMLQTLQSLFTFYFTAFASWPDLQELKAEFLRPSAPPPDGAHNGPPGAHAEADHGKERDPRPGRTLFEQALISNGFPAEICYDVDHHHQQEKYRLYESAFMGLFFKELWNDASRTSLVLTTSDHISFSVVDKQGNDRRRKAVELVESLISPIIQGEEREFAEALMAKVKNGTFYAWDKLAKILPAVVKAKTLEDLRQIHATSKDTSGFLNGTPMAILKDMDFTLPLFHDGKVYFAQDNFFGIELDKPPAEVAPFIDNRQFKDIFHAAMKDMISRSISTVKDNKQPFEPTLVNGLPQEYLENGVYSPEREDAFERARIFGTRIRSATVDLEQKGFTPTSTPLAFVSDGKNIRGKARKISLQTTRFFNKDVRGAMLPYGLEQDSGDAPKLMDGNHGPAGLADVWRRAAPLEARKLPQLYPFGMGVDASGRAVPIRETKEEYYARINNALLSSEKTKLQTVVGPQIATRLAGNFLYATLDAEMQDSRTEFAKRDSNGNIQYKMDENGQWVIDRQVDSNEASTALQKILQLAHSVWKYKTEGGRSGVGKTALITIRAAAISALRYFVVKNPHNGKVRTMEYHILAADSFDQTPWGALPEGATAKWVKQFQFYSGIVEAMQKNFANGDLRTLVKLDTKTGDINSANTKLVDELVDISRKLDTYANDEMTGFMSLDGVVGIKAENSKPESRVTYQEAMDTGEFLAIKLVNRRNPNDVQIHVTRSQSFFHFEAADLATYVDGVPGNKYYSARERMTINNENVDGPAIVIEVDPPNNEAKIPKGYAKKILTRTQFARVVSVASAEGETKEKLEIKDYALFAIIFSAEARAIYANRGFSNSWTKYAVTSTIAKFSKILPRETVEFLQKETPNLEGPDLYTMEQIYALFQGMGYKRTLNDLIRDTQQFGKYFVG